MTTPDGPAGAPPPDDAEAVRLAIAGDTRGHEILFRRHYPRVVATCRSYPSLDSGEAEDAAQDAFVRAFRSLAAVREPRHFGRWVLTIAHNRCRTLSARQGRRAEAMRQYVEEVHLATSHMREQETLTVHAVLEAIDDERTRRVARMYWLEGHTSGEISKEVGIPISTVTTWMSRLAARIRARLLADALEAQAARGEK